MPLDGRCLANIFAALWASAPEANRPHRSTEYRLHREAHKNVGKDNSVSILGMMIGKIIEDPLHNHGVMEFTIFDRPFLYQYYNHS